MASTMTVKVTPNTYIYLKHLRVKYGTMEKAIVNLITENKELKLQIGRLKSKVKGEQDFIKTAHLAAVSRPINIGQSQAQFTPVQNTFAPPPPPPKLLITNKPQRQMIDFKPSDDLKADLAKESKMVFDGQIRSPSEILQLCKPKHVESTVVEFEGTEPDLTETSHIVQLINDGSSEIDKFKKVIKL